MNRSIRFTTALSAIAVAGVLTGCASGQLGGGSKLQSSADSSNVGLGMRALAALEQKDFATAINFAERAVEHKADEATFRTVLGNAYFGAGRFASAEAAFRDSLTLNPSQPQVVLKLALAQIAQGRNGQALALLDSGRHMLDASDYGLAVALAGRPADAVAVLGQAARRADADARLRQNLALAYGLSGDWQKARIIAAQDLPADRVDARVQQWMAMAQPKHPADQVAALTGVTPVADPGQPVRLALNGTAEPAQRYAQVAPRAAVAPAAAPVVQRYAEVAPQAPTAPAPAPVAMPVAQAAPAPVVAEAALPELPQLPKLAPLAAPEPMAEAAEPQAVQQVAKALFQTAAKVSKPVEPLPTKFEKPRPAASYVAVAQRDRRAARAAPARGRSNSVVQLGAYGSPQQVANAWNQLSRRYPSLNRYRPVSARFDSRKGTFYRLAVKGFASNGEAQKACKALQGKGKSCFVRRVAGDAPVQLASR